MSANGWSEGTCSRCGAQGLVKSRLMAHTMSAIPHAEAERHCATCIRRMRINGLIALGTLLLAGIGIACVLFVR